MARYPNHYDLKNTLVYEHDVDRVMLECGSPATTYRAALSRGVITEEQYQAAARNFGAGWNYAGD